MTAVTYAVSPPISNEQLDDLFIASWPGAEGSDFAPILSRSLTYFCAYDGDRLIGFVNLVWERGIHAFLLDTTVHPDYRRRGLGSGLVREAIAVARTRGIEWLHVDLNRT